VSRPKPPSNNSSKRTPLAPLNSGVKWLLELLVNYQHVVYFTQKDGVPHVAIDRLLPDGTRDFCTHYLLPVVAGEKAGFELMDKVAAWLGNTLCIDNPQFREHIRIEPRPNA